MFPGKNGITPLQVQWSTRISVAQFSATLNLIKDKNDRNALDQNIVFDFDIKFKASPKVLWKCSMYSLEMRSKIFKTPEFCGPIPLIFSTNYFSQLYLWARFDEFAWTQKYHFLPNRIPSCTNYLYSNSLQIIYKNKKQ